MEKCEHKWVLLKKGQSYRYAELYSTDEFFCEKCLEKSGGELLSFEFESILQDKLKELDN